MQIPMQMQILQRPMPKPMPHAPRPMPRGRYRAALAISPRVASTYSALGFTEHLRGNLHEAIELYHQSLSLKADDTFTCEMLTEALKDVLEEPAADPTAVDNEMMDIEPAR